MDNKKIFLMSEKETFEIDCTTQKISSSSGKDVNLCIEAIQKEDKNIFFLNDLNMEDYYRAILNKYDTHKDTEEKIHQLYCLMDIITIGIREKTIRNTSYREIFQKIIDIEIPMDYENEKSENIKKIYQCLKHIKDKINEISLSSICDYNENKIKTVLNEAKEINKQLDYLNNCMLLLQHEIIKNNPSITHSCCNDFLIKFLISIPSKNKSHYLYFLNSEFEKEISKKDYPFNIVKNKTPIDEISNSRRRARIDIMKVNISTSANFIPSILLEKTVDRYFANWEIYCMSSMLDIINFYNHFNPTQKDGKISSIVTNEEAYHYIKQINHPITVTSLLIIDIALNLRNKLRAKCGKEKFEGFNGNGQINLKNEKDCNRFKNTVFDFSDFFTSVLMLKTPTEIPMYLTSDTGLKFIHEFYDLEKRERIYIKNKIDESFVNNIFEKKDTNIFENLIAFNSFNEGLICPPAENWEAKQWNPSPEKIDYIENLLYCKNTKDLIKTVLSQTQYKNYFSFKNCSVDCFYQAQKEFLDERFSKMSDILCIWLNGGITEEKQSGDFYFDYLVENLISFYVGYVRHEISNQLKNYL